VSKCGEKYGFYRLRSGGRGGGRKKIGTGGPDSFENSHPWQGKEKELNGPELVLAPKK